jgi:polysaccharide biosynthesis/export protein
MTLLPKNLAGAVAGLTLLLLASASLSVEQRPTGNDYIIGAGDMLEIQVWDHADLDRVIEVPSDGTFSFPFIGKVQASGKTVSTLEKQLMQRLSDGYLVAPQVTVGVAEYKHKKAFVFGEVNRPGSYVLKPEMRLLELISEAGGFTDDRGSACTIMRTSENHPDDKAIAESDAVEKKVIAVDLTRLIAGDPRENLLIEANDSVCINAAERVFVTGEVKKPGEIVYAEGMTVRQAISMAGGGTPKAAVGRTRILRMAGGKEIEIEPKLSDTILPNDIVKVPESYF